MLQIAMKLILQKWGVPCMNVGLWLSHCHVDITVGLERQFQPHYKVVETVEDGNCMFSAISDQLGCSMAKCDEIRHRHELIGYIREHHADLVSFNWLMTL